MVARARRNRGKTRHMRSPLVVDFIALTPFLLLARRRACRARPCRTPCSRATRCGRSPPEQPDHTHRRRLQRPAGDGQRRARLDDQRPDHRRGRRRAAGAPGVQPAGAPPQAAAAAAPPPRRPARRRPPARLLRGARRRHALRPRRHAGVRCRRSPPPNGLDPAGAAAHRHRAQAALRRARAGARRPARARPARRPGRRARARRRRASAPPTSSPSPRQYGVSPSLAAAIAWQESGFNNGMVSCANARGVMQVMPGTWDYVEQNLARPQARPDSATDNVHAGVLYLRHLLQPDRRRRVRRDRRLLPGPGLGPVARHASRHAEVRRQRAGAARRASGDRTGPTTAHRGAGGDRGSPGGWGEVLPTTARSCDGPR